MSRGPVPPRWRTVAGETGRPEPVRAGAQRRTRTDRFCGAKRARGAAGGGGEKTGPGGFRDGRRRPQVQRPSAAGQAPAGHRRHHAGAAPAASPVGSRAQQKTARGVAGSGMAQSSIGDPVREGSCPPTAGKFVSIDSASGEGAASGVGPGREGHPGGRPALDPGPSVGAGETVADDALADLERGREVRIRHGPAGDLG